MSNNLTNYIKAFQTVNNDQQRENFSLNLNLNEGITNTHSIGSVLYTDYIHLFQISGMILVVSMIGAIVLTYKKRDSLKRQSYIKQISRERRTGVELVDVKKNQGVSIDV